MCSRFLHRKGSPIKCHHLMTEKAKPTAPAGCRIRNYSASLSREVPRTFEDFPAQWSSRRKFSSAKLFCAKTFSSSSSKHQEILFDKFSRVTKPPVQVHAVFFVGFNLFPLNQGLVFLFCLCNEASLVQPFRNYSAFLFC